MASKPIATRSVDSLARQARRGCSCNGSNSRTWTAHRQLTTTARRPAGPEQSPTGTPPPRARWSHTPEKMTAPLSHIVNMRQPGTTTWVCNSDPARLAAFYRSFLGAGGETLLSEETRWLAVTHKSFDQGRRGFNDRLAFFGRQILQLQAKLTVLKSESITASQSTPDPAADRLPFEHPDLLGLTNLSDIQLSEVLNKNRLAAFARQMGMPDILRWKPRLMGNLDGSGIDTVLVSSLYAIIGAVALERGGDVAAKLARERVLQPLGVL